MIYLFIIAIVAVGAVEGLPLIRKKMWKELYALSSILGISVILVVLRELGLPTLFESLNHWLLPVGKSIFKYH